MTTKQILESLRAGESFRDAHGTVKAEEVSPELRFFDAMAILARAADRKKQS